MSLRLALTGNRRSWTFLLSGGAQDEGFAFTPDGADFYNIECSMDSMSTRLTRYDSADFCEKERFFENQTRLVLNDLEFDKLTGDCYLLGFIRDRATGIFEHGFVSVLRGGAAADMKKLDDKVYDYVQAYKIWERSGFTKKRLQWLYTLKKQKEITPVTLKQLFKQNGSL